MDQKLHAVVEQVFSSWTALQLAVEHGMVGPNGSLIIIDFVDYITQYCLETNNVDVSDIEQLLEDVLDDQFNTICEDNSPAEIANVLYRFLSLLREGNVAQYEHEFQNLPTSQRHLSKPLNPKPNTNAADATQSVAPIVSATPMEEDSEWTEVKSRRKK